MLSFPRHKDSPWPRRSMRKISQESFSVVCSTNSAHLEILLATPCSRTITGRGCLGERHRQYLILSPPATGKLCDTSLPDDFVINLECSPLVNESRRSSEKGSLLTAHGSYAILAGLSMRADTGLLRPINPPGPNDDEQFFLRPLQASGCWHRPSLQG